jgi:hypothetical protein
LSSGYWDVFDPNNGFTAIDASVARRLPLDQISRRWFFESDMLFRLGILRAVVTDVPMRARYGDESSSLVVRSVVPQFAWKHFVNTCKRIAYNYYLRNFNIASIEIALGLLFFAGGMTFGLSRWAAGSASAVATNSGTVMVAALPVIIGVQLILAFLSYDTQNVPKDVLHERLAPDL